MVSCSTTLFRCKCLGGLRVLYNNTGNTLLIEEMGYHSSARGRCTYYVLGSVRPINCPIRIACIWKVITTVVCSCWRNGRQSGSECHGDAKPLAPYSSVPPWPLDPPPKQTTFITQLQQGYPTCFSRSRPPYKSGTRSHREIKCSGRSPCDMHLGR